MRIDLRVLLSEEEETRKKIWSLKKHLWAIATGQNKTKWTIPLNCISWKWDKEKIWDFGKNHPSGQFTERQTLNLQRTMNNDCQSQPLLLYPYRSKQIQMTDSDPHTNININILNQEAFREASFFPFLYWIYVPLFRQNMLPFWGFYIVLSNKVYCRHCVVLDCKSRSMANSQ